MHYINLQIDSFNDKQEIKKNKVLFKNRGPIPDGDNIKIFTGIFSENYSKWKKSRNGYKYDQEGWDLKNYMKSPIILWQHNETYGWIGKALELYLDENNNLWGKFYVDLDLLDDRNRKQVERWMVTMLSTGAITLDWAFEENKTGKRYSENDAIEKFWISEVLNALNNIKNSILTYVVTKAELVENSLVTIWSNAWALAKSLNSIDDEMLEKAKKLESLYFNNTTMKKNELETEVTEPEVEETEGEWVTEVESEVEEEVTTNDVEEEVTEEVTAEPTEKVETETNSITELKKSINAKDALIEWLTERVSKLENEIRNLREAKRSKILANANISNTVASMEDFSKKYF